jgi:hypothetical protein
VAAAPDPPDPLLSHVLSAEPRVSGVLFFGQSSLARRLGWSWSAFFRTTHRCPRARLRQGGAPGLAAQNSSNGLGAAGMTAGGGVGSAASGIGSGSIGIGTAPADDAAVWRKSE